MSVRTQDMEIETYMALAGLRALRNVQIHAKKGLIRFVGTGQSRRVRITVKGETNLVNRGRIVDETRQKKVSFRLPKKLVRVKGTDGLPVVRSWRDAATWLGVSESALRERKLGFIIVDEKTLPLVSSVEQLKYDLT